MNRASGGNSRNSRVTVVIPTTGLRAVRFLALANAARPAHSFAFALPLTRFCVAASQLQKCALNPASTWTELLRPLCALLPIKKVQHAAMNASHALFQRL
jgi:hypothetical protein